MIETLASFLDYWTKARERTTRVHDRIPNDDLEWREASDRFSFGDLFRHLAAAERYMWAETVSGRPSSYPGHDISLAEDKDGVRAFMTQCHDESMVLFRALSDDQLLAKCTTPGGAHLTTYKWLRAMTEHEAHHRGQLYTMAAMLDIPLPPLFGLTEPEVKARSTSQPQ